MIIKNESINYALSQMAHEIEHKLDILNNEAQDQYIVGLKTAYVEILEIIQMWESHSLYGLDYKIEAKYPIDIMCNSKRNKFNFPD